MDGEVGEMDSFSGVCRRGLAALANEELAEPPARETRLGLETGEAALGNGSDERLQEPGRFGARTGKDGVDEPKTGGRAWA